LPKLASGNIARMSNNASTVTINVRQVFVWCAAALSLRLDTNMTNLEANVEAAVTAANRLADALGVPDVVVYEKL
jgi:hypothetical protein